MIAARAADAAMLNALMASTFRTCINWSIDVALEVCITVAMYVAKVLTKAISETTKRRLMDND
jgi:hypothetical protein